jgi:hypothetical protein
MYIHLSVVYKHRKEDPTTCQLNKVHNNNEIVTTAAVASAAAAATTIIKNNK